MTSSELAEIGRRARTIRRRRGLRLDVAAGLAGVADLTGSPTSGLTPKEVPGEQDGEIMHAEVRWPEGGIVMIGSDDRRSEFTDHNRPGTNSLYVVTDHPDEVFARATAAGAQVVRDMEDTDYGSRGSTVRDPEGNLWSFGTYCGA